MSIQDHYANITITPVIRDSQRPETVYYITHDGDLSTAWFDRGPYTTLEAVLAAFSPPLSASFQAAVLSTLSNGEYITFSSEHAFDSL